MFRSPFKAPFSRSIMTFVTRTHTFPTYISIGTLDTKRYYPLFVNAGLYRENYFPTHYAFGVHRENLFPLYYEASIQNQKNYFPVYYAVGVQDAKNYFPTYYVVSVQDAKNYFNLLIDISMLWQDKEPVTPFWIRKDGDNTESWTKKAGSVADWGQE